MAMSAAIRKATPAVKSNSKKTTVSSAIQAATARLPIIDSVFGNSMVELMFSVFLSELGVAGEIRGLL